VEKIYLDHHATTPIDPEVLSRTIEALQSSPSNPSSPHYFGQQSKARLENARHFIAQSFGFTPSEMIFTSGATEALFQLLSSIPAHSHVITTSLEHAAIYEPLLHFKTTKGLSITYLPIQNQGAPSCQDFVDAITPNTTVLVLSAANSETGIKVDWSAFAKLAEQRSIPFFLDAVGIVGKEPFVPPKGVTAMVLSGHKIHAPQGIGALFCRSSYLLSPLLIGGPQEWQKRAGTQNFAGALALQKAIELISPPYIGPIQSHLRLLQTHFEHRLKQAIPELHIHGQVMPRAPSVSNLMFPQVDGETLLIQLDLQGIAVSLGAACSSGARQPSRILLEMGCSLEEAKNSIRVSYSRRTTLKEIDRAADTIIATALQLAQLSNRST
jgi:cysteine desulfurase